jgi:hypothetical protein
LSPEGEEQEGEEYQRQQEEPCRDDAPEHAPSPFATPRPVDLHAHAAVPKASKPFTKPMIPPIPVPQSSEQPPSAISLGAPVFSGGEPARPFSG